MQAKSCVHVKKEHLAFRFRRVWSNQSAIFSFIDRGHLRVLLHHRTPEKAHELFNLLFLSIQEILKYEVSELGNTNPFLNPEQFSKNYIHFKKTRTKFETWTSFRIHKDFLKTPIFYKNMNIIWICEHFFRTGTCVENSYLKKMCIF